MKIRLMGTEKENQDFIKALEKMKCYEIRSVSGSYQNRNSKEARVYVELDKKRGGKS